MKIAYITNRFPPAFGGAERFLSLLLDELSKYPDFSAEVLTSDLRYSDGQKKIPTELQVPRYNNNILVKRLPAYRLLGRDALTVIPALRKELIALSNVDIVHTFTYGYQTSWLPALMKSRNTIFPKIIFSPFFAPNNIYPKIVTAIFNNTLGKISIKIADKVVLLSNTYTNFFETHSKNLTVILPPIAPIQSLDESTKNTVRAKLGIEKTHTVILSLCRLTKSKGNHLLIDGFNEYLKRHQRSDIRLIIAGSGEEYSKLLEQIDKFGLQQRISVLKNISDEQRVELFNIADVFALLSYSGESFGMTQVEAMSLGLPVIASKTGVSKYILHSKQNGELVDPFDPNDIATAINTVLSQEKTYYSAPNIEESKRYLPEVIATQYHELYSSIINNK